MTQRVEPPERGIPEFRNMKFENVIVKKAGKAFQVLAYPEKPMRGFTWRDVTVEAAEAGSIRHAADWTFERFNLDTADGGPVKVEESTAVAPPAPKRKDLRCRLPGLYSCQDFGRHWLFCCCCWSFGGSWVGADHSFQGAGSYQPGGERWSGVSPRTQGSPGLLEASLPVETPLITRHSPRSQNAAAAGLFREPRRCGRSAGGGGAVGMGEGLFGAVTGDPRSRPGSRSPGSCPGTTRVGIRGRRRSAG